MKNLTVTTAIFAVLTASLSFADASKPASNDDIPVITVTADFRPAQQQKIPVSLTTIDSEAVESRGAQHLEDVLNLAPNVNMSSGASRGKFFQIRGIGERSQFAAAINPSVGLIIDGIDFSRTGGAATLFDIEQVEILRGPQGTRYGTNALAGIVNMQSKQPTEDLEVHVETGFAEFGTTNLGVAVSGPLLEDSLLGRLSVNSYQSDGFMKNAFLNRDDTQKRDEITARGHLKWLVDDDLTVDLNVLLLDIDNGYDAFTFDNSRNTLTDDPGRDTQQTNAIALKTDWRVSDALQLQSNLTYSASDTVYRYDADWGFDGQFDAALFPYVGFEQFIRDRENASLELRALSNENGRIFNDTTDWVVGFYYLNQQEGLDQNSDFGVFGTTLLVNQYDTKNTAVFAQLDTQLNDRLTLISGLRVEYFEADYNDSNALNIDTNEVLFGGKIGLNYQLSNEQLLYSSLSRGYKSGGVNTDASITAAQRDFDTEFLWSVEAGVKSSWLEGALRTNIGVFYALRKDAQVKSSLQIGPQFIDFQANAAKGKNIGIEADVNWLVMKQWRVLAALGLLDATFDEYDNADLLANGIDINGRRQAHAPAYQFNVASEHYISDHWTFKANVEGKDGFFYSNSHNAKSGSYALVNSSLDYSNDNWKVTLWGKNLFDREYTTRGFFFGNDPSIGYADRTYTQLGDRRMLGMSFSWDYY